MSTKTLYGLIEFSSPIFCSADALGKTVDVTIGIQAGTLTLPSLPAWGAKEEHPLDKCLVTPDEARTWNRGEEALYWGRPSSYPSGESCVKLALLKMDLPQDNFESTSQEVYKHFPAWIALFEQYVALLTTQNTRGSVSDESGPGHLELLTYKEDKLTYIPTLRIDERTFHLNWDDSLHFEQLEKAASFSSKNLSPRLEYKMLLQSYIARHHEDYRKAIIEAASALEISLTKRLEEEFQNQNISFGEELLKKYRMLSGRFELVRVLGIQLPNTEKHYRTCVIEPRNDVVHKADFPARQIVNQFIREVEEILRLFSPVIHE